MLEVRMTAVFFIQLYKPRYIEYDWEIIVQIMKSV